MPGRKFTQTNSSYRYGFNGKENDKDAGEGIQDYGMRIYDARLGKFLSVDPLSKKYPMLTPYQFASNRPIDGIDQDGLEWSRRVTYNIATGVFTVNLHDNIKLLNHSAADVKQVGDEFKKAMMNSLSGVYDERRKIQYSGTGSYQVVDNDDDIHSNLVELKAGRRLAGRPYIAGVNFGPNSQANSVGIVAETTDETGCREFRDPARIGNNIVHEQGHNVNVSHPFDDDNAARDVDLTEAGKTKNDNGQSVLNFVPSQGADTKKIMTNIMMYTITYVNGVKVGKNIITPLSLSKFSPDQCAIILEQIRKDLNNSKQPATNPAAATTIPEKNTTQKIDEKNN